MAVSPELAGTNELREPPSHVPCRPPRLSGHGRRGALHVRRMAGVWGAGVAMVVVPGVLGPVALIPQPVRDRAVRSISAVFPRGTARRFLISAVCEEKYGGD